MDKILIISDLHLCRQRDDLFLLFQHFMKKIAPASSQLFVLGDLFEIWVGDDSLNQCDEDAEFNRRVIDCFKKYSDSGRPLFFMHGNRDFLLGKTFERLTGGKILSEPYLLDFNHKKTALMHGDSLCTDDVAYQEFRAMVRNPKWQAQFLSLSIAERVKIASGIRATSKQSQQSKTAEIMDVNQQSVDAAFVENEIDWMIHGHTHRQATHNLSIGNKAVQRIVLSDWGPRGFYLKITDGVYSSEYFELDDTLDLG